MSDEVKVIKKIEPDRTTPPRFWNKIAASVALTVIGVIELIFSTKLGWLALVLGLTNIAVSLVILTMGILENNKNVKKH